MLSRRIRAASIAAIVLSLIGVTVLAADPWNTGNPWNAPSVAPSPDAAQVPLSSVSSVPSVAAVPSVGTLAPLSYGVVPTPGPAPVSAPTPIAPTTANGIGLTGDPSSGAHVVMMKCAGCHEQDGSGHGVQLIELNPKRQPIPWTDKAQMSQLTDQQIAAKISQGNRQDAPDSAMPAFGDQLNSQQISDVVAYIRTLEQ